MVITQVRVRKLKDNETKLKGLAGITLDEMFAIHDIKLLESDQRFLAMPSRALKTNTFCDIVHPINAQVRELLERLLFAAYDRCEDYVKWKLKEGCDKPLFELTIDDYEVFE